MPQPDDRKDFMATVSIPGGPENLLVMKGPFAVIQQTLQILNIYNSLQGQQDPVWCVVCGRIPGSETRCWALQWAEPQTDGGRR
jgi:hypothetical protein